MTVAMAVIAPGAYFATSYCIKTGRKLALPPHISEPPPETALGVLAGYTAGAGSLFAHLRFLKTFEHALVFDMPANATSLGLRGILRAFGPVISSSGLIVGVTSVPFGVMGFVTTKIDILRLQE